MRLVSNEKGEVIDELQELLDNKNKDILELLKKDIKKAEKELVLNNDRKRPVRVANMMTQRIFTALSKYDLMSNEEYVKLNKEDLQQYFQSFMDFISNFSEFEVPITKQLLCAYMGLTVVKYNKLIEDTDNESIKEYANYINDVINGMIFASAEGGNIDSKSALTRGKIKDVGQNFVEIKEEISVNTNTKIVSQKELEAETTRLLKQAGFLPSNKQ